MKSYPKHLKAVSCLNLTDLIEHFGGLTNPGADLGHKGCGSIKFVLTSVSFAED